MSNNVLALIVCIANLPVTSVAASGIEIPDWAFDSAVVQSPGNTVGQGTNTPQNPYNTTELAVLGISSASTERSYAWSSDNGQFPATVSLAAAGAGTLDLLLAGSGGGMFVSSTSDLLLNIDAFYSYALGPGDRVAELRLNVFRVGPNQLLYYSYHEAQPILGHPPTGSFTVQHEMILPAGITYNISYQMQLWSFGGSPDVLSYGNGHANFYLQAVPDPATGALLAPAALFVFRRRRHP